MSKINSLKYAALLHLTELSGGPLNQLFYQWLLDETGESGGTLSQVEYAFLAQYGFTEGPPNQRWHAFLGYLGYDAVGLPGRLNQFWGDYQEQFMPAQDVTITTTQFAALHTTGIEIVPTPGADKVIVPIKIVSNSSATGTAPSGANVTVRWTEGEPASGNLTLTVGSVTFDATEEATEAVAEVEDVALEVKASGALAVAGAIVTTSIGAAGTLYTANDVLSIGDATITVNTVGVGGDVLTYTVTTAGTNNVTGNGQATTGGTGSGFTLDIDSVDVTANVYTMKVKVIYNVFDIS